MNRAGVLLLAAVALTATACTGSGHPAPPPPRPIAGHDRIVVSWCDRWAAPSTTSPGDSDDVVTVVAYSTDGTELVRHFATLPDGGKAATLCTSTWGTSAAAVRQAFNADFTLIAGTVPGKGGQGTVATAFALPGGKPVAIGDPGPDPKDGSPTFQSGSSTLWYETADHHVASRNLGHPKDAPTYRAIAPGDDFTLGGEQPWLQRPLDTKADQVSVAPNGAAAAGSVQGGFAVWLPTDPGSGFGSQYAEPPVVGRPTNGRAVMPGSEQTPPCDPRLWFDARTLLCVGDHDLMRVTLAADYSRVEKTQHLLPDNALAPVDPVLSPDGRSLAFLQLDEHGAELYRLDLTPGAEPVRMTAIPDGSLAVQGPKTEPGRPRLIVWQ